VGGKKGLFGMQQIPKTWRMEVGWEAEWLAQLG
jgi:hypothetical protein